MTYKWVLPRLLGLILAVVFGLVLALAVVSASHFGGFAGPGVMATGSPAGGPARHRIPTSSASAQRIRHDERRAHARADARPGPRMAARPGPSDPRLVALVTQAPVAPPATGPRS